MVRGMFKSRSLRRVYVKTPGGKTVLRYRFRKPNLAKCGKCGKTLKGIPRERPYKMKNLAKTKKRPERMFGGVLCSACSRNEIKRRARQ